MSKRMNLLLLYGGKSGEHEISLLSAASVLAHLNPEIYHVIPVGMDKEGCFFLNDYEELKAHTKSLPVRTESSRQLPGLLENGKLAVDAEVILPIVHGPLYEDGCLQGLLQLTGTPYVGCSVLASAIGMDKDISRRLTETKNIRSARYRTLSWHASPVQKAEFCRQTAEELGWPLFVKPCSLGSSVGIHKVSSLNELQEAVQDALRFDETIVVEEFLKGREIELAVLENHHPANAPLVSVPGEIKVHHKDGFYSYTAKYLESEATELIVPAVLEEDLVARLQKTAADIFVLLKCRGLARVDFFVNDSTGDIYFNEINTLPGFTSISMYPKMWQASGIEYTALLDKLIELAMIHHRCREQLVTSYQ